MLHSLVIGTSFHLPTRKYENMIDLILPPSYDDFFVGFNFLSQNDLPIALVTLQIG